MIGVLTLFGEVNLQPVLKKIFMQNDMVFISENCNTSVQLIDRVHEHYKETDVIVIAAAAMNMQMFSEAVSEIRGLESKLRIILILNGNKEQYLESQLLEYEEARVDVLYDDNGFDTQDLIDLVKQGKLSKQRSKEPKKQAAAKGFKQIPAFPGLKNKDEQKPEIVKMPAEEQPREISQAKQQIIRKSFSQPKGRYTIGIFNVTHGAGATTASIHLAEYFSLHGYVAKLIDMSGTNALSLIDIKGVETSIGASELEAFKEEANALIIDFGTPYDITPAGDNFKISYGYTPENIRKITQCNIKIILGFTDKWNIGKIKFFLNNEQWRETIDDSFVFLVAGDEKILSSEYPEINIMHRDNYRDEILQVLKEEE